METCDFFKYRELEEDLSKDEILDKQFSCGYINIEPFTYDSSFVLLRDSIMDDFEIMSLKQPIGRPCKNRVRKSVRLWEDMGIKLHDVNCFRYPRLHIIKLIHPCRIPIEVGDYFDVGYYSYIETFYNSVGMVANGNTLVGRIHLSRTNEMLSVCGYNHEITHSQLFSDKGSCTNILNSETLPILMECIFADYIDPTGRSLEMLGKIRISDIAEKIFELSTRTEITYEERVTSDTYVKSTLQAISLINRYVSSNRPARKEMLGDVRRIFNGMFTVEDMISKYESDVENVPKDLKYLKRSFKKK